jgi:hypothetical protein
MLSSAKVSPLVAITEKATKLLKKFNYNAKVQVKKKMEIYGTMNDINPIFLFDIIDKQKKADEEQKNNEKKATTSTSKTTDVFNFVEDSHIKEVIEVSIEDENKILRNLKCGGLASSNILQLETKLKQGVFVRQYGILHPSVLWNVVTFQWVNLAEHHNNDGELDLKAQKINEYSNIGLLSALVFTVI